MPADNDSGRSVDVLSTVMPGDGLLCPDNLPLPRAKHDHNRPLEKKRKEKKRK